MAIVSGRNLRLYIDGVAMAYAQNCTLSLEREFIEKAPTSSGAAKWSEYEPRRMSARIGFSVLYGTSANKDMADLEAAFIAGTIITADVKYDQAGEWSFEGSGYFSRLSIQAPTTANATGIGEIIISGAVVRTTIS